jgi:hypothetical protein
VTISVFSGWNRHLFHPFFLKLLYGDPEAIEGHSKGKNQKK